MAVAREAMLCRFPGRRTGDDPPGLPSPPLLVFLSPLYTAGPEGRGQLASVLHYHLDFFVVVGVAGGPGSGGGDGGNRERPPPPPPMGRRKKK